MIKPELFDDPDVGALSPSARWLFAGLLTQADRRGRLIDDPRRLKTRLCAYDQSDVDALLEELSSAKLISRYDVAGRKCLQIRSFEKHQRPHPKEPESIIPAQVGPRAGENNFSTRRKTANPSLTESGSLESGSLGSGERSTDHFEVFWQRYPRKVAKDAARREWEKLAPDNDLAATMIAKVLEQRASAQWLKDGGQFIPHARTWLHQGRWKDEQNQLSTLSENTVKQALAAQEFCRDGRR